MARNRMRLEGLDEFKAALRTLPRELSDEAQSIVLGIAEEAKSEVYTAYPEVTGNLRKGLKVIKETSPFGTRAIMKNTAPHAWIYDNGSEARHWETGKSTGKMWGKRPPTHIFVSTAIRKRREMRQRLLGLLLRSGATKVSDGG